ncbi:hypothetical protein MKW98_026106 [Papaver atlanticum]|uniref:Uncharacterized protein n=1 Tax=Papaver atlanticum TaxID=357466 RepID=A0AAD4RY27_9MAGN|nr:hypothetical protein MKW98_026106 [Papaver atlanticum]
MTIEARKLYFNKDGSATKKLHISLWSYYVIFEVVRGGSRNSNALDLFYNYAAIYFLNVVECHKYPGFYITHQRQDYPFVKIFHCPQQKSAVASIASFRNLSSFNKLIEEPIRKRVGMVLLKW